MSEIFRSRIDLIRAAFPCFDDLSCLYELYQGDLNMITVGALCNDIWGCCPSVVGGYLWRRCEIQRGLEKGNIKLNEAKSNSCLENFWRPFFAFLYCMLHMLLVCY